MKNRIRETYSDSANAIVVRDVCNIHPAKLFLDVSCHEKNTSTEYLKESIE